MNTQYMGNINSVDGMQKVDTNQMNNTMAYSTGSCGCNMNMNSCCQNDCPTYQCCNQVVNRCFYQDVPHYINYHTHVINNCVKRHYNVPTYTQDEETVYINEQVAAPFNAQNGGFNPFGNNFNPLGY